MPPAAYNRAQLADALRRVGLQSGQVVFSHGNLGFFGLPEEGSDAEAVCRVVLGAFQDVLGPEGVLAVPAFTYSFCRGEVFDVRRTPSVCGIFTEFLRRHPRAARSRDPIFSTAALGRAARELTRDASEECFGPGSFWDRFLQADGVICNLNLDAGSTFIHYVEKRLQAPYRYDKLFLGETVDASGRRRPGRAVYFCQDLSNPDAAADFSGFDRLARAEGLARTAPVGRGRVAAIRARDVLELISRELPRNPRLLTAGGGATRPHAPAPTPAPRISVRIPPGASPAAMIKTLHRLPRDMVCDGHDAALDCLGAEIPLNIHRFPSGTRWRDRVVPERWTCRRAELATEGGELIFSSRENRRRAASYSRPFDGVVSRAELWAHLHVHPRLPDAVPCRGILYRSDWGLCCSRRRRDRLRDARYRVVIDSHTSFGSLKVGQAEAPGAGSSVILLWAETGDAAGVAGGLAGAAAGVEVVRRLRAAGGAGAACRLLLTPDIMGLGLYLERRPELAERLVMAVRLEALGFERPHLWRRLAPGDSRESRRWTEALDRRGALLAEAGPGADRDHGLHNLFPTGVPVWSLSRALPPDSPHAPYPERASSLDGPELVDPDRLRRSCRLLIELLRAGGR